MCDGSDNYFKGYKHEENLRTGKQRSCEGPSYICTDVAEIMVWNTKSWFRYHCQQAKQGVGFFENAVNGSAIQLHSP